MFKYWVLFGMRVLLLVLFILAMNSGQTIEMAVYASAFVISAHIEAVEFEVVGVLDMVNDNKIDDENEVKTNETI